MTLTATWRDVITVNLTSQQPKSQAGRRLVRSLLTLRVFVVDVMD